MNQDESSRVPTTSSAWRNMAPVWAWPKTASASPWPDGDGTLRGWGGWGGWGWLRPYRFFNLDVFEYAFVLVF